VKAPAVRAHTEYRPDIDGLRAVAIAAVVLYHAFPRVLPGGFVGVDIFFVISGYLITRLIIADLQVDTFSVIGFYQRRIRRIFPALLVVLVACTVCGWYVLLPGEFSWFGRTLLWCAPFLANAFFATTSGYFDPGAATNPLLHLWSLGVEEQFYLIWPLLLPLAWHRGLTRQILVAIFATSLAISIWGAWFSPATHFYLPGARAWELALGALLVVVVPDVRAVLSGARASIAHACSLLGLSLIAVSVVALTTQLALPGAWGLLPTCGAALLIAAGPAALVNRRLLALPTAIFVGRISYSLYLWHWPLLSFARIILGHAPSTTLTLILIAVATLAAYASYVWIETPIRHGAAGRAAVPALLCALALLALAGAVVKWGRIPARLEGPAIAWWESVINDWSFPAVRRDGLWIATARSMRTQTAVFIGDSHMAQYWSRAAGVIAAHPTEARSAVFATYTSCPPMPGVEVARHGRSCVRLFDHALQLAYDTHVDTVVFGSFWEMYLLGEFPRQWDSHTYPIYRAGDGWHRTLTLSSPGAQSALEDFRRTLTALVASGRRVFILLSNPTSPSFDPPLRVSAAVRLGLRAPTREAFAQRQHSVDDQPFMDFVAPLMTRLREIANDSGASVIDPASFLCVDAACPVTAADGRPLYLDSNHLSASFAREHAGFIDQVLLRPQ
jgi:peptidoglycan/LPS O-acetylase OafA/YrhL